MSNALSPSRTLARIVLCADDFALTAGVSRGILALIAAGKLTATGAMTNRPHWVPWSKALLDHADRADLGVHLNLTCAAPLTAMPVVAGNGTLPDLATILRLAILSPVAREEIAREIEAQLDAFAQATGRAPDFVDGHQHVHALPFVRGALLSVAGRMFPASKPYLRDPADRAASILSRKACVAKGLLISALASGFGTAAHRAGFATNDGFSGVSDFRADGTFAEDLRRYVIRPGSRHLVMCHPGEVDAELPSLDPVVASRAEELAILSETDFGALGVEIVRFNALSKAQVR